ncbi:MAG: permease [Candidatus Bathyarchaeota archaeon]|nr:permease [Candidatus Bathyarchaeota archaeon]
MIDMFMNVTSFLVTILIEIIPLFLLVTFFAGLALEYISQETLRRYLAGRRGFVGLLLAVVFGFITPFCSCSTIPVLAGMIAAGIPIGVLTAFLFASPYPVEIALIVLGPIFGWILAFTFVLVGAVIAFLSGVVVEKIGWQKQVKPILMPFVAVDAIDNGTAETANVDFKIKVKHAAKYSFDFFKKLAVYIVLGSIIGAFMYGFVPADLITTYAGNSNILAVPIAALIGAPLYVSIIPIIPIIYSLYLKGLNAGAVIAFLITATAISPPELIMLSGMFKKKFIAFFIIAMIAGSIITGYLFNVILLGG